MILRGKLIQLISLFPKQCWTENVVTVILRLIIGQCITKFDLGGKKSEMIDSWKNKEKQSPISGIALGQELGRCHPERALLYALQLG
jgi:hypothetical protein